MVGGAGRHCWDGAVDWPCWGFVTSFVVSFCCLRRECSASLPAVVEEEITTTKKKHQQQYCEGGNERVIADLDAMAFSPFLSFRQSAADNFAVVVVC